MTGREYWAGLDVGSTTIKSALVDAETRELVRSVYRRHYLKQIDTVYDILTDLFSVGDKDRVKVAVCGSGGQHIADKLGVPFIQEVAANSIAVRTFYKDIRTAVELGGHPWLKKKKSKEKSVPIRLSASCSTAFSGIFSIKRPEPWAG